MTTPQKFLLEARDELRKVVWPTRAEIIRLTLVVLTISLLVGLYIGVLDYVFAKIVEFIISLRK